MIKKLSSRIVYENKWMKVREDDVEFPDGTKGIYGVVEKSDAALIIPKLEDRFVLVKPYRYPIGEAYWEFPHGGVEEKELEAQEIATQELEEETGYKADRISKLATLYTSYGYSNQIVHIFVAEELVEGERNHDSGEQGMEIESFSESQIDDMILSGEMTDTQTIAAWGIFKIKKDEE